MRFKEVKTPFTRLFAPLSSFCFRTLFYSPKTVIVRMLRKSDSLLQFYRSRCTFCFPLRPGYLAFTIPPPFLYECSQGDRSLCTCIA